MMRLFPSDDLREPDGTEVLKTRFTTPASMAILLRGSGWEYIDLCPLIGAQSKFNSCEDLHGGFCAILSGNDQSTI